MVNFHAISAFLRSDLGPSSFWAAGPRPNSLKTKEGLVVKVVQGQIAQQKVKHLCFFFINLLAVLNYYYAEIRR